MVIGLGLIYGGGHSRCKKTSNSSLLSGQVALKLCLSWANLSCSGNDLFGKQMA